MTALVWTPGTDPGYESGLDHGVLYLPGVPGVSWNGLVSVDHSFDGGKVDSYFLDGVRYYNMVGSRTFKADLASIGFPDSFGPCVGRVALRPGVFLTAQPRTPFSMAYRTKLGSSHYKIHLIYNAYATIQDVAHTTLGGSVKPVLYTLNLTTVPEDSDTYRPTAHLIVDSSKVDPTALSELEDILYGTGVFNSSLPTQEDVNDLFAV